MILLHFAGRINNLLQVGRRVGNKAEVLLFLVLRFDNAAAALQQVIIFSLTRIPKIFLILVFRLLIFEAGAPLPHHVTLVIQQVLRASAFIFKFLRFLFQPSS